LDKQSTTVTVIFFNYQVFWEVFLDQQQQVVVSTIVHNLNLAVATDQLLIAFRNLCNVVVIELERLVQIVKHVVCHQTVHIHQQNVV
jgi:hypothetical protein